MTDKVYHNLLRTGPSSSGLQVSDKLAQIHHKTGVFNSVFRTELFLLDMTLSKRGFAFTFLGEPVLNQESPEILKVET